MTSPSLPADLQQALDALRHDLSAIFGDRIRSLVVYGLYARPEIPQPTGRRRAPLNTLALVDRVEYTDLRACARRARRWARTGLAMPLVLSVREFERSVDAFPLEYGNIMAHHIVIAGEDLLAEATVRPEDLRRACEIQVRSHLIHLREGYLEAGGKPSVLAALIVASAEPFASLLANVARLLREKPGARADLSPRGETMAGLNPELVRRIVSLRYPRDLSPADAQALFPEYLDAVERLWQFVDQWTA